MAEATDADEKQAVIPEVPTQITAAQVIAVILSLAACRYASGVLVPLLVAVLTAIALAPLVRALTRVAPRWLAAAIVVLGIAGACGFTAWSLSDDIATFSQRLPQLIREVRDVIRSATPRQTVLRQLQQAVTELEQTTAPAKPTNATPVTVVETMDVQRQLMSWARSAGSFVSLAILLMFLVYFLLASGDLFKQKFVKLSGKRLSQRKVTLQMIDEIIAQVGRYVFYLAWSGVLVGALTWAAFAWIGVRYAPLWGIAAGVMNCIPYFGPAVIMVTSAAAAGMQFRDPSTVMLVAGASLAITSLEGFLIAPIALGKAASVNSVAVFVSVMFWGWMWGTAGLLLGVPILMITKTVADHVESLSSLSQLLDER
jgi:predicted PurR-regulated permease PerM